MELLTTKADGLVPLLIPHVEQHWVHDRVKRLDLR